MPYIIRNAKGEICGRCINKPGDGNKLPDGSVERVEYIKEDTPEVLAWLEQREKHLTALMAAAKNKGNQDAQPAGNNP